MCVQWRKKTLPAGAGADEKPKARTGKRWVRWLFPVTGLAALIWFLVRVIPKPSRAEYPCQRVAFPLASSFIAYILGLGITAILVHKARRRLYQSRYILAAICLVAGLGAAFFTISLHSRYAGAAFAPADPPNTPMGVAKGIFPGRVAWVHDANATYWDPAWDGRTDIHYWDDSHTDANVVEEMFSNALGWLTGEVTDEAAWDKLFKHFNQTHGKGNVGYAPGEKIAIKPNFVEHRRHNDVDNYADISPQMVVALLKQLIWEAGIDQNCITVCDSARYISNKIFYKCHNLFPDVTYTETNYYIFDVNDIGTDPNRPPVQPTDVNIIFYSSLNYRNNNNPIPNDKIPVPFYEADYVINFAVMKCHPLAGVTLSGKNWYGCFCTKPGQWAPNDAHHQMHPDKVPAYSNYRPIVDLMGHEHLGGKTMLFILDGLYGFQREAKAGSEPKRWSYSPFNNDYPSSILMSQDHVAIDSVGLDFLRAQFADNMGGTYISGAIDDYLHEAALADDPCSGTFYDPMHPLGDPCKTRIGSIGVHEHWNDPNNKQYSRNLGAGAGIELVFSPTTNPLGPLNGDIDDDYSVNFADLFLLAQDWLEIGVIDSNLVAWYSLDESSGSTAYDSSGNNYNGTLAGGVYWAPAGGKTTGAANFSDSNDGRIQIPTTGIKAAAGAVVLWARLTEPQRLGGDGYRFFFGCRNNEINRIQLYMDHYDTWLDMGLGNMHKRRENIKHLATDTWYHIAFVWQANNPTDPNAGTYTVYVDGMEEPNGTGTYAGLAGVPSIADIGNNGVSHLQAFDGFIDEVGIYDRALDANEIMQIYQGAPPANLSGDLNEDYKVDFNDYVILANDWYKCNIMPQVFQEGFEDCNLAGWYATDSNAWRIEDANGRPGKALSLFTQSVYTPPYTSPRNINLVPDVNVGSFVMELQMLSTKPYYAGRDLIVFFGYQDPAHFYYAHIADVADDVHNRIHIVDGAPRAPIDETRNSGNNWGGGWHTIRLVRNIDSGKIEVYFDDMNTPVMTATNTRFLQGKVGVGSFDDVGQFDNIKIWGR